MFSMCAVAIPAKVLISLCLSGMYYSVSLSTNGLRCAGEGYKIC